MVTRAAEQRGRLIALEGIDGAGTTTQARLLTAWLSERLDAPAVQTCEPSDGPLGQLLRQILGHKTRAVARSGLALLFAADRLDHLEAVVQPLLRQGRHVVTDRYVYSSLAYQSMDLDLSWVAAINQQAPEPDLTVYIRVDPGVAGQRRKGRGLRAEVFETDPEQRRIASIYDSFFGTDPGSGSWELDPIGSRWIQADPPPGAPVLAGIGRNPCWAVVDGHASAEEVHDNLKNLVQNICVSN